MAFILLIRGRPIYSEPQFRQISPTQWTISVDAPATVPDIAFALAKALPADDLGVAVSFTYGSLQSCEFLGAVSNARPTDIFMTTWPWTGVDSAVVHLILSIEGAALLMEKAALKPPLDIQKELATKIAMNLFRFVESYNQSGTRTLVTSPSNVLDAWLRRFNDKRRTDPNFVLRSE